MAAYSSGGAPGGMSSATSDPNTAHMRVFVGNLNTLNITKPSLQNIFGKYGDITAISIHRGFAFVQYSNAYAAREAVQGEHRSVVAGQTIDVNLASEPKPNQKPASMGTTTQSFGGGYEANGSYNSGGGGWNAPAKRGRGMRGGIRGAAVVRGLGRGIRGRGALRGKPIGVPNKVQAGRVEKAYQIAKSKLNTTKKPVLPALAAHGLPVESHVIGSIGGPLKGTITAATGPDGQTVDLAGLRKELEAVRDRINSLLEIFPAQLTVDENNEEESEANAADDSMELEEVKKEV